MALATAESIRDRIAEVLVALTPTSLSGDKFRQYRNEGAADFEDSMEKNPSGALRRFQIRETSDDELPETTSGIEERVRVRYTLRVAYPQTHRYGSGNAMDRDDVMNADWKAINYAVGIYGGANFTGTYDAIPLGATKTRVAGQAIDYLVVTLDLEYLRSVA
jgi:hypothetical protein